MIVKRLTLLSHCIILALCMAFTANAAGTSRPVWEEISTETTSSEIGNSDTRRDNVDIELRDGSIYIRALQPVKVEIFTILGQLVTAKQVRPGITRLSIGQRGIYILKAGGVARRVNI